MTLVDRARLVAVLITTGTVGLASVHTAHAQSPEAEVLFRDGRTLIKRGKLAAGCDKLAASERLESSVGTLLNLGDCREKLGKLASAWAAFRKAEATARRTGGDDKRQEEAGRRASQLEPRLPYLVIEVNSPVEGMVVRRDGGVVEQAVWNTPLPVDPGSYAIVAEAPGHRPWTMDVPVRGEGRRQVVVVPPLDRVPVAEAPAEPGPDAGPRVPSQRVIHRGTWSGTRVLSAGLAIAGVGALGTGVYFGLHARDLEDRADQRCPLAVCTDADALRWNDEARTSATRANILYIAGGAAVATAVVLWLVGAPDETIVVVPSAGDHHAGISLAGSF